MQSNKDPAQPINGKKNCSAGWCGQAWGSWRKASTRGRGVVRSRAMSTASLASAPLMTNFSGTWSPHPFTYSKGPFLDKTASSLSQCPISCKDLALCPWTCNMKQQSRSHQNWQEMGDGIKFSPTSDTQGKALITCTLPQKRNWTNLEYNPANDLRRRAWGRADREVPGDLVNDPISEANADMYSINSSSTKSHESGCTN